MSEKPGGYAIPEATTQRLTVGAVGPWPHVVADLPSDSVLVEWDRCEASDEPDRWMTKAGQEQAIDELIEKIRRA